MVRVAQVVNRVHKWLVVPLQLTHHLGQRIGADGIKTEVQVKDIERVVVLVDPARFEHQRWPPPSGHLASVGGDWIIKSHNVINAVRIGQMSYINVRCRHGRDAHQIPPLKETTVKPSARKRRWRAIAGIRRSIP